MEIDELIKVHPRLYHMADGEAWDGIARHGLLSTAALVDLYDPPQEKRDEVLRGRRRKTVELRANGLPVAWVRDQKPLRLLPQRITDGTSEQDFLNALNERVFFWLTEDRLERLLHAYRAKPRLILTISTAKLIDAHLADVELAPYNTGAVNRPDFPVRDASVFTSIGEFPYDEWRKKRRNRKKAVVELTVKRGVTGVPELLERLERVADGERVTIDIPE